MKGSCPVCGERCTCSTLPEPVPPPSAHVPLSTRLPDMGSVGSSVGYGAAAQMYTPIVTYPDANPYTDHDFAHAWDRGNMAGERRGVRRVLEDLKSLGYNTDDFTLKYNAILHASREGIEARAQNFAATALAAGSEDRPVTLSVRMYASKGDGKGKTLEGTVQTTERIIEEGLTVTIKKDPAP